MAAEPAEGTSVTAPLSAADLRSQILSSIPEEAEKPADPEPEATEEPAAEPSEDEATEEAEPAEDDADADDGDEDDSPKEETTDDPKALKGLDVVRRAEKRHREKMDADRAEFAREREKHAESLTKVGEYEAAAKRIAHDPVALLDKLGVPKDAYELIAHAIFAESKTGETDPARKAQASVRLRERAASDDLAETKKEIAAVRAQLEQQKIDAENAKHASVYIDQLNTAATTKHPLVAHMLKADPQDTSDLLAATYERLAKASNKEPTPAQVVAELDRKERGRLMKLGLDPDVALKLPGKKVVEVAGKKPVNGTAVATKSTNGIKTKAEIVAELEAL